MSGIFQELQHHSFTLIHSLSSSPSKKACNSVSSKHDFYLISTVLLQQPFPFQFVGQQVKLGVTVAVRVCCLWPWRATQKRFLWNGTQITWGTCPPHPFQTHLFSKHRGIRCHRTPTGRLLYLPTALIRTKLHVTRKCNVSCHHAVHCDTGKSKECM